MIGLLFLFAACQEKVTSPARVDTLPSIFPDYVGVTIPSTIAPLNFRVTDDGVEAVDVVIAGTKGKPVRLNGRSVDIPAKQWHELLVCSLSREGDIPCQGGYIAIDIPRLCRGYHSLYHCPA